jgi:hypothetical protein
VGLFSPPIPVHHRIVALGSQRSIPSKIGVDSEGPRPRQNDFKVAGEHTLEPMDRIEALEKRVAELEQRRSDFPWRQATEGAASAADSRTVWVEQMKLRIATFKKAAT